MPLWILTISPENIFTGLRESGNRRRERARKARALAGTGDRSSGSSSYGGSGGVSRPNDSTLERTVIDRSVEVAEGRFKSLSGEYWHLWVTSGDGYERFVGWLDAIRRRVLAELAPVWKGNSDVIDDWYERACRPAVEAALEPLVREWKGRARAAELKALENDPESIGSQDQPGVVRRVGKGPRQRTETFLDAHHPKFMYHPTKHPVQVFSRKEIEELGPEWSEVYIHQEYPKCKYHWDGKTITVKTLEEERALGGGWADTPAAFDVYSDPTQARPKEPDPLKWVDQWPPTLSYPGQLKKIKAELLKAHAKFWKSPDYPSATAESMRQAFNGIAQVLLDCGLLTESILENDLDELVWDSAIAGGWWHLAAETPRDIFPKKIGHHWVWLDHTREWPTLFRGETAEWHARLLDSPAVVSERAESDPRTVGTRRAAGFEHTQSPAEASGKQATRGKRGRKAVFSLDQLQKARAMKQAGKSNNEIAKLLYQTQTPTPERRRSVPTILKHHFGSKN